jgi:DNA polymerase I-like protein with 3'-5' exonuclease and polymerase domains
MPPSSSSKPMNFLTLDIETTMGDTNPKRASSNPYSPDNEIVAVGVKLRGVDKCATKIVAVGDSLTLKEGEMGATINSFVLVGHNIKFDLSYIRARFDGGLPGYDRWIDRAHIWDTQIAEYVLTQQRNTFAGLDNLARERGLGGKDSVEFRAPLGARGVPEIELLTYLERDLILTEQLAELQMSEATNEQFDLIMQMGNTLKTIVEMEGNGMHVNEDVIIDKLARVGIEQHKIETTLKDWCASVELVEAKPEWYNSPNILSCMIFGGSVQYVKRTGVGLYKTGAKKGKVRYKNRDVKQYFPGFVAPGSATVRATKCKRTTKSGEYLYSVDEATLDRISKTCLLAHTDAELIENITRLRALKKAAGTYYENLLDMHIGGIVHHSINQCATSTGRTSSSQPNLQNIPMPGEDPVLNVKECFTSRYGKSGVILEIDFKQLEVCALAWLTRDPQMLSDIRDGIDIHSTIADMIGWDVTDKEVRRKVKTVVFAMIYGAGAKGIAASSGIPEASVKAIMKTFHRRYPAIKPYFIELEEIISKAPRYDLLARDGDGNPAPMFEWTSPTGRTYVFNQDAFRPGPAYTQVRNYPVQGTATGDIVPVVLGEIGTVLRNASTSINAGVAMVTTTHDSITFDCETRMAMGHLIILLDKEVFSRINNVINARIPTIKWDVPLVVEYEAGPDWGNMKSLDISTFT